VSHDYDFGEWKPDAQFTLDAPGKPVGRDPISKVFYWVVPANVTGEWKFVVRRAGRRQEFSLKLAQKFQFAEGTVETRAASRRTAGCEARRAAADVQGASARCRWPDACA
jgi:hypothetical protein